MLSAEQVDRYRPDGYLFPLPALSPVEITISLTVSTVSSGGLACR